MHWSNAIKGNWSLYLCRKEEFGKKTSTKLTIGRPVVQTIFVQNSRDLPPHSDQQSTRERRAQASYRMSIDSPLQIRVFSLYITSHTNAFHLQDWNCSLILIIALPAISHLISFATNTTEIQTAIVLVVALIYISIIVCRTFKTNAFTSCCRHPSGSPESSSWEQD